MYTCSKCGHELFPSESKFKHDSPWPAFSSTCSNQSVSVLSSVSPFLLCSCCSLSLSVCVCVCVCVCGFVFRFSFTSSLISSFLYFFQPVTHGVVRWTHGLTMILCQDSRLKHICEPSRPISPLNRFAIGID